MAGIVAGIMVEPVVLTSTRFINGSGGRVGGWGRAVLAAAVIAGVSACGPAPAAEVDDSTTVAAAPTTRTPRIVDDSGRPDITFDPCLDLPDDVMTAAGYDAARKEFADMPMGSYTFLGCYYEGTQSIPGELRQYTLNILSGNVSLDEELGKNGHVATATTVNDRSALREIDPSNTDTCTYVLESSFGVVIIGRIYNADHARGVPEDQWCAGMEEFVGTLETYIDS